MKYKGTIYYIISIFILSLYKCMEYKRRQHPKEYYDGSFLFAVLFPAQVPCPLLSSYFVPKMADSNGLDHWGPLLASFPNAEYWRLGEEETLGISSPLHPALCWFSSNRHSPLLRQPFLCDFSVQRPPISSLRECNNNNVLLMLLLFGCLNISF